MNLQLRFLATVLTTTALAFAAGPVRAAAEQHDYTLPLVDINNPCTPGNDSIDGSIDIHGVTKFDAGNVAFVRFNAKGTAVDAAGRNYQAGAIGKFQFHDPLPGTVFLQLRLVSQGGAPNAFLVLALHVNEQGRLTHAEYSGIECRG